MFLGRTIPTKPYPSRLSKENGLYKKEVEELKKKHDKLTAEKAEEWDIKNAVRINKLILGSLNLMAEIDSGENAGRVVQNGHRQRDATR